MNAGYSIEMRPTQSVLRRIGGGCTLLQRCGKRDFLSIRVRKSCEINANTYVHVIQTSLDTEEKLRHESNGHAEYDNRCEICAKTSISRHPRRVYPESCAFDSASVTYKGSVGYVTVLTGRGPRCECFCRVLPRKGQRLKDLEHFLAVMRARYPSLQVRSDNEEALKHVLRDFCEKVHFEYSDTCLEIPASNGRGENSVRDMKEMVQRQKMQFSRWTLSFSFRVVGATQ